MKNVATVYAVLLTGLMVMGIFSITSIVTGIDAQTGPGSGGFLFDQLGRPISQNNTTSQAPASASSTFLFDRDGKPIVQSQMPVMCNQPYGLCTVAKCVPLKSDPTKALCSCILQDGISLGQNNCSERQPVDLYHDNTLGWMISKGAPFGQLTSTYSFINSLPTTEGVIPNRLIDLNYTGNYILKSCQGAPWANCLDMQCFVPPADPTADISQDHKAADYAICQCAMVTDTPEYYMTTQGSENCANPDVCHQYLWSAAYAKTMKAGISTLKTYLATHPTEDPAQQFAMPICSNCTNTTQ